MARFAHRFIVCLLLAFVLSPNLLVAQRGPEPGKSIGKVSVSGDLILLELNEGALGTQNLFDLNHHTLRFRPLGSGYRVENLPFQWDSDFGEEIKGSEVSLQKFQFPFSGKKWDAFSVGTNGSIRFGGAASDAGAGLGAGDRSRGGLAGRIGGVQIGRFDQLADAAGAIINTFPAICVFMKPRMLGARYAKELSDRVVVSWDVTEPYGNIQDFTWYKTINRFQAVLHQDGSVEMSYDRLAAKDAVVGVYPLVSAGAEKTLATIPGSRSAAASDAQHLRDVKVASVGGLFLRVTLETRGDALSEGDGKLAGLTYHVFFHLNKSAASGENNAAVVWTIRGFSPPNREGNRRSRYFAFGPGLERRVEVSGRTISMQGIVPPELRGASQVFVSADVSTSDSPTPVDTVAPGEVKLGSLHSPEVDLSSLKPTDGPFPIVYEAFHYDALPNPRDLTCSVIQALGDKFDFLAYYSDFRVDNQEAGTPSNGPLGSTGPAVTGIGAEQRGLESYCSAGRFQWQFIQPVYSGAIQMQERPPAGAPVGNDRDITHYRQQLGEISQDEQLPPYMYAMSQIAHEMGHRWAAFVSAKVGNETIPLGPTHWARGLQAPVAFPYRRPVEASIMGGGVWQDNHDGTYTQLDDDYYVPATGWSYLDLYLMGLIKAEEVPDFFVLRNLEPTGNDADGHPMFKAERTKVSIQDVIAAEGPRTPEVDKSQRQFNTGFVMVVEHGKEPSRALVDETNGIRRQWLEYWPITTGHRASMTANPK